MVAERRENIEGVGVRAARIDGVEARVATLRWTDHGDVAWSVDLTFQVIRGRVECVGVALVNSSEVVLTTASYRQFPLATLIRAARTDFEWEMADLVGARSGSLASSEGRSFSIKSVDISRSRDAGLGPFANREPRRGRPPVPMDVLERVAEVYLTAPDKPTKTVADVLGYSPTKAINYVSRARREGLIAPTTPGRVSGRNEEGS